MTPYYTDESVTLHLGNACEVLRDLPPGSVDCIVTSPPYYGLRDYGHDDQIGMEGSPSEYVNALCGTFQAAKRTLADDGTLWLNLGDSYVSLGGAAGAMASNLGTACLERPEARDPEKFGRWNREWGLPAKNLLGIPWRVAFALQEDGWILRNAVVWHKPNAMPSSVTDRLSNRYEMVFLFSKSPRYWFDLDAIRGLDGASAAAGGIASNLAPHPRGKNPGDMWSITTKPYSEAHFATFPIDLPTRCIKAGCKPGGTVLDPFSGSGTTGAAARELGRKYVGIDLNAAYHDLAMKRFAQGVLDFGEAS